MRRFLSFVLLTGGVILILIGISGAGSMASGFTRMFTGALTERTTWLLGVGLLAIVVGLAGTLRDAGS